MGKENFQCLSCGHKFKENKYNVSFQNGEPIYRKEGKFLKCPECNSTSLEDITEFKGFCTNFGKFSSSTPEQKKQILKKRSREHSERRLKERRDYLDRNFGGRTRDVDFKTNE